MHRRALRLAGDLIPRSQPRLVDQRCEERRDDIVERAVITFRTAELLVPVVNISARGAMIECDIQPRIGEAIVVQFECCAKIHAFVRWVRDGHVGLNFGHELVLG